MAGKNDCSDSCGRAADCHSFSYKYFTSSSSSSSGSSMNCLLSRVPVGSLDFRDTQSDSNWDVYEFLADEGGCRSGNDGANGNSISGEFQY